MNNKYNTESAGLEIVAIILVAGALVVAAGIGAYMWAITLF